MKTILRGIKPRIFTAMTVGALCSSYGFFVSLAAVMAVLLVNPSFSFSGAFPTPGGSTVAQLTGATTGGAQEQQIIWELEIVQSAYQQSPFSDNMVGRVGSGKPIVEHTSTKEVAGQAIVINTVDSLGAPIIQGNAVRIGNGEQLKPGTFQLLTSIAFIGVEIDNTGMTQTVIGRTWDRTTQTLLARRMAKQQNDDRIQCLKMSALSFNTKFPNGKTIDTLLSSDTFQTSLIQGSSSLAKDIGAIAMNAAKNTDSTSMAPPPIHRFLQFLTDAGARSIKAEPAYQQGLSYAADRGKDNPLFTGDYQEWDNNIIYPWVNVRHGGYGPIGSALQPEALLGTPILAHSSGVNIYLPVQSAASGDGTHGCLDGGGSATAATLTPYRNYFENFSRFTYAPIAGTFGTAGPASGGGAIPLSYTPRATYGYCALVDKTAGGWSFFRYTTNSVTPYTGLGNVLSGVKRLGSVAEGDYATTLGSVVWNTAPYLTAGDGNGFTLSEGAVAAGSVIYETNSKGVALAFGFCLGEMALVEGYGVVPINGGASFKAMVNRRDYEYPLGNGFARGLDVAWGVSAFQRPDGNTPNYVLNIFSRSIPGFPNVTS